MLIRHLCCFVVIGLCCSSVSGTSHEFSPCQEMSKKSLFLDALECLEDRVGDSVSEQEINREIQKLDKRARQIKEILGTRYANRQYKLGYFAWRNQQDLAARNHWLRFLEFASRNNAPLDQPRLNEVQAYFTLANMLIQDEDFIADPKNDESKEKLKKQKVKRQRKNRRKKSVHKKKTRRTQNNTAQSINTLMSKAGLARKNGRLEASARLYELALQLAPNRPDIQSLLKQVRNEMQ